jgi:hypothetical protein
LELLKNDILVDARNHVWGLDEGEGEGGFEVEASGACTLKLWNVNLNELIETAQSLLLWKDIEL